MKNKDEKAKEPYEPEDTPTPPQVIEPNSKRSRENPVEEENRPDNRQNVQKDANKQERPHLLADEADIDDETTI